MKKRQWHIARWPWTAWLETGVKLAAHAVAIGALLGTLGAGSLALPEGARLAQSVVLALLSLGLLAAIGDRIIEREIVAMAFVIVNNVAHWGMVATLASAGGPGAALPIFAGLMLVGDLVKLVFLRTYRFRVRDIPPVVLYGLTLFYVAGYAAILALELVP